MEIEGCDYLKKWRLFCTSFLSSSSVLHCRVNCKFKWWTRRCAACIVFQVHVDRISYDASSMPELLHSFTISRLEQRQQHVMCRLQFIVSLYIIFIGTTRRRRVVESSESMNGGGWMACVVKRFATAPSMSILLFLLLLVLS